jgi:hypothetical protein
MHRSIAAARSALKPIPDLQREEIADIFPLEVSSRRLTFNFCSIIVNYVIVKRFIGKKLLRMPLTGGNKDIS